MGLVYVCPDCGEGMVLRPRHSGHEVPCPRCGASVDVPGALTFRRLTRASIADRRVAGWHLFWAGVACVLWLPPVTAYVWWRMSGLVRSAQDEGRNVIEEVRTARIVSAVGFVAQAAFYLKWALHAF